MDGELKDDHAWAARYRRSATEARERAKAVTSEETRQKLLTLAAEYDDLAAEHERKIAHKYLT